METITSDQIKIIHTILPARFKASPEDKGAFIAQFTEDETKTSTKDLTKLQAEELIYFLKTGKLKDYGYYAVFDTKNKQHNYLLSLCHQLGWVVYSNSYKRLVVDLKRLGGWLYKYGYLHKPLNDYSKTELPKLITQFENIVKTQLKR